MRLGGAHFPTAPPVVRLGGAHFPTAPPYVVCKSHRWCGGAVGAAGAHYSDTHPEVVWKKMQAKFNRPLLSEQERPLTSFLELCFVYVLEGETENFLAL